MRGCISLADNNPQGQSKNARYFDKLNMLAVGSSCVSNKPFEYSLFACLLSRMFFDTLHPLDDARRHPAGAQSLASA